MKRSDFTILTIAITLFVLAISAVLSYVSVKIYHKDDAPLEELAEEIVKETTGIDIDFTPDSKEQDVVETPLKPEPTPHCLNLSIHD